MTVNPSKDSGLTFLVDFRVAQFNRDRGIPAYSQSIVRQICLDKPEHRYLFLWDKRLPKPAFAGEFERYGTWEVGSSLARGKYGRIDVLFTAGFFSDPRWSGRGGRCEEYLYPRWLHLHQPHRLGIVYDLIPYMFPQRYLTNRKIREHYMAAFRVMRESDRLFAISQATRHDTIRLAGFDPGRIRCVYGDIDHRKRSLIEAGSSRDPKVPERFGLRPPYAVYIGGDDWRKNMDGMVSAFAHFHARHPEWQLAVICKFSREQIAHYQQTAASLGIRPGAMVFTGYLSDEDLVAITLQAEMMAYPSLYEGLGLPVLEAYGCGIPVVGSNSSSIKELVIPELTCDPHEPLSIAMTMDRLVGSPTLRERSLARGRELLGNLGWSQAARAVLEEVSDQRPQPVGNEVAVVGALPPARTAIAPYTLDHLQSDRWRTWFFDSNSGPILATNRFLHPGNRVLPVEVLRPTLAREDLGTLVFVLGNSEHHVKVLRAMMQTRLGCRQRRLAYLHEVNLSGLLRTYFGDDYETLRGGSGECCDSDEPWIRLAIDRVPEIGRSLRFLADAADLDGLIVNSDACRRLIRAALGPDANRWSIDVTLLPIVADLAGRPAPRAAGETLRVGTFGTGGDTKQLGLVAAAMDLLAQHRPVRLTIAGWSAARQCRRLGIGSQPFIEVHDEPSDEVLAALMREVDVAVQLRVPTHGESSAAVVRLLGLGTHVIVTGEGSFRELPPTLTTGLPSSASAGDVAAAIEAATAHRLTDADVRAAIAPFAPAVFAERMAAIFSAAAAPRQARVPA